MGDFTHLPTKSNGPETNPGPNDWGGVADPSKTVQQQVCCYLCLARLTWQLRARI